MASPENKQALPVQERLIMAAMTCFLNDDYHRVTTRQIATAADTNISMIRYYFGNKEGLYEEMIRHTLQPLLDVLDSKLLSTTQGFADYFRLYYRSMSENPRFPALILKVLALKHGPANASSTSCWNGDAAAASSGSRRSKSRGSSKRRSMPTGYASLS